MPNERQLTLHTPTLSGNQALLVRRIEGREGLSQLFSYDVTLYARSENVDFSHVLGHEMCIGLELPAGGERYFHGYVASFGNIGSDGEFTIYRAELKPHLWRLTRSSNCRIFQGVSVPEIVEGILKDYGIDIKPDYDGGNRKVNYLPWNYCVQYRETDFAFISRLLEQEGLHYYFRHEKDKHTLVLADSNVGVQAGAIKNYEKVEYTRALNMSNRREGAGGVPSELVWDFRLTSSVLTDRVALLDFDFRTPKEPLGRDSGSEVAREHGRAMPSEYEVYDPVESVVQQDGYSAELTADYARMRAEEAHVRYAVASAQTDARGLCAGAVVALAKGPECSKNKHYLILRTELSAEMDVRSSSSGGGAGPVYHCWFEAIDHKHPYRAPRVTPKPIIPGPQSAIVAGPKGSGDLATDEWGRIFVKFHWARKLKDDDRDLSCWVRVSQNSAGAQWGSMFIPHIGQEVLVGFLEGDPDRPVVIGKVYNGSNKPPLTLPDHGTKSVLRDKYANQVIFDATPGEEHIALYSPTESSTLILGKNQLAFTHSNAISASYDSTSYAFGTSKSFTRGSSFALKKGTTASVSSGVNLSASIGADIKVAASTSFDFKAGLAFTVQMSTSASWGFGRDFKKAKGSYTRMSESTVLLDSQKSAFVSGGLKDCTMLFSTDEEIGLSFDPAAVERLTAIKAADSQALKAAGMYAGLAATFATVSAFAYEQVNHTKEIAQTNDRGYMIGRQVMAEFDEFETFTAGDVAAIAAGVASAAGGILPTKHDDIPPPSHPGPSAKIVIRDALVKLFAGKKEDAEIFMTEKDGIAITAKKEVRIASEGSTLHLASKKDLTLKSGTAVIIDCRIKHRSMEVLP